MRGYINPIKGSQDIIIIIIAQDWPCWLSTAALLRLPISGVFAPLRHMIHFEFSSFLPSSSVWWYLRLAYNTTEWQHKWAKVMALALGSFPFLQHLMPNLCGHRGIFIFSTKQFLGSASLRFELPTFDLHVGSTSLLRLGAC